MEWSKIEQEWKKKLEEGTITPSTAAWDKLESQLDIRAAQGKKITYKKWLGLVACLFVGGILGLVVVQSQKTDPLPTTKFSIQENAIVVEDKDINQPKQDSERIVEKGMPIKMEKQEGVVINKTNEQWEYAEIQQLVSIPHKREAIDSLVIDEIWVKKPQEKVMVDSNNLLKLVEGEIEVEYRETKLKKIIDTAKKTVVDISDSRYEK